MLSVRVDQPIEGTNMHHEMKRYQCFDDDDDIFR